MGCLPYRLKEFTFFTLAYFLSMNIFKMCSLTDILLISKEL